MKLESRKRPEINIIKTGAELKCWYWLKQELVDFSKTKGISYVGTKFDILERLAAFIDDGETHKNNVSPAQKKKSQFDWSKESLSPQTLITDSYTNGTNTRRFFKQYCHEKFRFTIPFMAYMKANCGKTLQDAINEWHRLDQLSKEKSYKSDIPSGNQYNQYIRDFFIDNPNMNIEDARHYWKLKRSLPLGLHKYEKSDLSL